MQCNNPRNKLNAANNSHLIIFIGVANCPYLSQFSHGIGSCRCSQSNVAGVVGGRGSGHHQPGHRRQWSLQTGGGVGRGGGVGDVIATTVSGATRWAGGGRVEIVGTAGGRHSVMADAVAAAVHSTHCTGVVERGGIVRQQRHFSVLRAAARLAIRRAIGAAVEVGRKGTTSSSTTSTTVVNTSDSTVSSRRTGQLCVIISRQH